MLTRVDDRRFPDDPLTTFRAWLEEAKTAVPLAEAMTLATAGGDGRPSARVVLLRGIDERGFVFYTNRTSRKGREILENPVAALVFHWYELGRQVRVEGSVEEVTVEESESYWSTRPRESQVAAWASPQSRRISSREELERLCAEAEADLGNGGIVPLPSFWGGYRVIASTVEFWEHRENRLHDRLRYVRRPDGWCRERLAP